MNLKDALLCIDCDEVFTVQGSRCNPRCPVCASSVLVPLSAWVETRNALDHAADETNVKACDDTPERRQRMEIIHPTPIAA